MSAGQWQHACFAIFGWRQVICSMPHRGNTCSTCNNLHISTLLCATNMWRLPAAHIELRMQEIFVTATTKLLHNILAAKEVCFQACSLDKCTNCGFWHTYNNFINAKKLVNRWQPLSKSIFKRKLCKVYLFVKYIVIIR